jgi:malate dehydrogenase
MAEAILYDKKHILPCAIWLQGEYGLKDVYVGVPAKLGARGLEEVIPLKLSADEQAALNKSAESVRELQTITGV